MIPVPHGLVGWLLEWGVPVAAILGFAAVILIFRRQR
jgi:hypothetical protein